MSGTAARAGPEPVPAPHELAAAIAAARPDLDHQDLLALLLGAQIAGMPQGQIWSAVGQILARGEHLHDLRNAVRAWQRANPQPRREGAQSV